MGSPKPHSEKHLGLDAKHNNWGTVLNLCLEDDSVTEKYFEGGNQFRSLGSALEL